MDAETRDRVAPEPESAYETPRPIVDEGISNNQPVNRDSGYLSPIPLIERNGSGNSQNGPAYKNVDDASVQKESHNDDYVEILENLANAQNYEHVEMSAN